MPYAPGVTYQGQDLIYDSIKRSSQQFNNFMAAFLMSNKSTEAVNDPNAPDMAAFAAGGGPQRDPNATMPAPKASLMDRLTAGAQGAAEGYDQYKQQSDESNALEKLLKTMYPEQKTRIDTMSLGEKRGMLQAGQVQQAMQTAKQNALVKMLQAQTAVQRAKTAQDQADAKANKAAPSVAEGTTSYGVPYATYGNTIHFSDELAPNNPKYPDRTAPKTIGQPPSDVKPPKGYDWIWNGKTWVMGKAPTVKSGGMESLFPSAGGAGAAGAAAGGVDWVWDGTKLVPPK